MKPQIVMMQFTKAYEKQDFWKGISKDIDVEWIQLADITGTNCYCDEASKEEIRKRVSGYSYQGLHFLDSGNYHYASLFWLEKITTPFSLVVFDFHPDMQPPAFGDITSCGGWVKEALATNDFLQKVYLVGVSKELIEELSELETYEASVVFMDSISQGDELLKEEQNPIYISFDKDVLHPNYTYCQWSQGEMTLPEAIEMLEVLVREKDILGMDICGEDSELIEDKASLINQSTNGALLEFWKNKCLKS